MLKLLKLELSGILCRRMLIIFAASVVFLSTLAWWGVESLGTMEYKIKYISLPHQAVRTGWDTSVWTKITPTAENIRAFLDYFINLQLPKIFTMIPTVMLTLFVSIFITSKGFTRKYLLAADYPEYPRWKVFAVRLLIFYAAAFTVLAASIYCILCVKFRLTWTPYLPAYVSRYILAWLSFGMAGISAAFLISSALRYVKHIAWVTLGVLLVPAALVDVYTIWVRGYALPQNEPVILTVISAVITLACTAVSYLVYCRAKFKFEGESHEKTTEA